MSPREKLEKLIFSIQSKPESHHLIDCVIKFNLLVFGSSIEIQMDVRSFFVFGWLFGFIFKLERNGLEDVDVFVLVFGVGSESDLVLLIGGLLVVLESEDFLLIILGIVVVSLGLSFLFNRILISFVGEVDEETQIAFVAFILEKSRI